MTSSSPISSPFVGSTFVNFQNEVQTSNTAGAQPASYQNIDATEHVNRNSSPANTAASYLLPAPTTSGASAGAACQTLNAFTPSSVGTDIYAVMALFQKMAQEQRTTARQMRETEMQAQVQTLHEAANEIRAAAQDRFIGAVVSGSVQILGGLTQMGAGAVSMGLSIQSSNILGKSNIGDVDFKRIENLQGYGQAISGMGQGLSGSMNGAGSMVSAGLEFAASNHDARKAELEAIAKVHDSATQQANELMQQMMDVIRDVRDKLAAMDQSRLETNRGIARNI